MVPSDEKLPPTQVAQWNQSQGWDLDVRAPSEAWVAWRGPRSWGEAEVSTLHSCLPLPAAERGASSLQWLLQGRVTPCGLRSIHCNLQMLSIRSLS
jgi:hypothetical protein